MIEILHLGLSYLWFNIFSATWWRINRTWTRKNSWSERAKCPLWPRSCHRITTLQSCYRFNKVQPFNHTHPTSRQWFALDCWALSKVTHKLWFNNNSSWKFEMTSGNAAGVNESQSCYLGSVWPWSTNELFDLKWHWLITITLPGHVLTMNRLCDLVWPLEHCCAMIMISYWE